MRKVGQLGPNGKRKSTKTTYGLILDSIPKVVNR
jgi:hypothetical protein